MKTQSVQKAHTINRDGQLVPGNGFKQPTPTVSMHRPNLWMHSIERKDLGHPAKETFISFIIVAAIAIVGLFLIHSLAIH